MTADVCLVVPCYNEADRLPRERLLTFLAAQPRVCACLVNDGSTDRTADVLRAVRDQNPNQVLVLELGTNRGKAEAVRRGVQHVRAAGRFDYIGYWDADLSTPLEELDGFLHAFDERPACRFVLGSRVKRLGANIDRLLVRHLLGRIFATVASNVLDLPVYDSQCGAKLFRADVADVMFGDPFVTSWLFDVELLARLRNAVGREAVLASVVEVPLGTWVDVKGSKLRAGHMVQVPAQFWRIHARYNRGRTSDVRR